MSQRRFNSSISIVGIKEPKVQQALLKLLENSLYLNEKLDKKISELKDENQQLRQMIAQIK
jgi:hypothetical protein